jgi:hypothetical protein
MSWERLMSWKTLTPSDEVEAADWIRERLHPFAAYDVGAVVPTDFEAYARIFHPASVSRDWKEEEVRWSEVAAWSGRTVHPEMQFHAIAAPAAPGREGKPLPWSGEPRLGVLSKSQSGALVGLLSGFTSTPDSCWFCLWEGYGQVSGAIAWLTAVEAGSPPSASPRRPPRWHLGARSPRATRSLPERKRVRLPNRDYLLFREPLAKAEGWEDGPNLWWPDDRAWCVASEIDLPYTYVGGPKDLVDAILKSPAIEALPARDTDGISYSSDTVNG